MEGTDTRPAEGPRPEPADSHRAFVGEILLDPRFNGSHGKANAGLACGMLARLVGEPAEVTLASLPPLATPLPVVSDGEGVRLVDADTVHASAVEIDFPELEPPVRPTEIEVVKASGRHSGRTRGSSTAECFVCGPGRGMLGDGLGVSPGPLNGDPDVGAAMFVPDERVSAGRRVPPEMVWAVLDCTSFLPSMWERSDRFRLERFAVARERDLLVGERLVAVGWLRLESEPRRYTASCLIDARGNTVARAIATWGEPAR